VALRTARGLGRGLATLALACAAVAAVAAKPAGHPRRRAVDTIIVHSLGGPDCRDGRRFYRTIDGDARTWMATFRALPIVSIHYMIGRDGQVEAGVPEAEAATHAVGWNQRSIGIELVNNGDGTDPFPEAQVAALVRLVHDIRRRHPEITPDRVWRHSDVDHSTFAAARHGEGCTQFRRKEDPGAAFPWAAFQAAIATD
jgi:N-acetylmuramoyl-L-alanine amidase